MRKPSKAQADALRMIEQHGAFVGTSGSPFHRMPNGGVCYIPARTWKVMLVEGWVARTGPRAFSAIVPYAITAVGIEAICTGKRAATEEE